MISSYQSSFVRPSSASLSSPVWWPVLNNTDDFCHQRGITQKTLLPICKKGLFIWIIFSWLVSLGSNRVGWGNPLTHKINFRLTSASVAIGASLSRWADRLDWHCNSSLWFPPPNAPLIAQISPVGFHHTKESCQRSLQCVTSPSATAVMFPLLLTSISPTPLFFLSKPLLTLVWAGDFLPERSELSFF